MYERILGLCENSRINVTDMCRLAGVPRSSVGNLATGKTRQLSAKNIQKISEFFNVSADYLVSGEEKEKPATKSDELTFDDFTYALYNEAGKLTEENKAKLLEMAKFFQMQQEKEKSND